MTDYRAEELETDRIADALLLTDEERQHIIDALGNDQPVLRGFVDTRSPFEDIDDYAEPDQPASTQ